MKRFLLLLPVLLVLAVASQAQQVPNGGLETWTTTTTGDHAQSWLTSDDIILAVLGLPLLTATTTKTTDKYAGTYAAKVETKNVPPFGNVPGYLVLGTKVNAGTGGFGGLPFTGRPAAMQLRYKLSGSNLATDSAVASIMLTRTVNGHATVIAEGGKVLAAASAYTLSTVPLTYHSVLAPDSMRIIISSGLGTTITAGTTLYVDDIALTGTATATRTDAVANSLTLYPNPSADGLFTLEAAQEPALLATALTVSDLLGRTVLAQAAVPSTTNRAVDLRGQPAGVYTLSLATAQGPIVRRLVIQ